MVRLMAIKIIIKPKMLNGNQKKFAKKSMKKIIKANAEVFKKLE